MKGVVSTNSCLDKLNPVPYENLCNGIILRAVDDYVRVAVAKKKLEARVHPGCDYGRILKGYEIEITQIRRFIFSEWFQQLTTVDPAIVWAGMESKVRRIIAERKKREAAKREKESQSKRGQADTGEKRVDSRGDGVPV